MEWSSFDDRSDVVGDLHLEQDSVDERFQLLSKRALIFLPIFIEYSIPIHIIVLESNLDIYQE